MLDVEKLEEYFDVYSDCKEVFELQKNWENEQAFLKLIDLRQVIPAELYAVCLRMIYQTDTDEVSSKTLKNAFKKVKREDIMYPEELELYECFPSKITIYRGTQDSEEIIPRISWSIDKSVAEGFAVRHLFCAEIDKDTVIGYFSRGTDESEVVAIVETGFKKIY